VAHVAIVVGAEVESAEGYDDVAFAEAVQAVDEGDDLSDVTDEIDGGGLE